MKNVIIILLFAALISQQISAQEREGRYGDRKRLKMVEQLEKTKLIEILDMDENTSVRFFARRNEHQQKMRDIFEEREKIINELKNSIDNDNVKDSYYKDQVTKMLELENKMSSERENFYKSLSSILSPRQIAKYAVFEFMFRRELTHSLMKERKFDIKIK